MWFAMSPSPWPLWRIAWQSSQDAQTLANFQVLQLLPLIFTFTLHFHSLSLSQLDSQLDIGVSWSFLFLETPSKPSWRSEATSSGAKSGHAPWGSGGMLTIAWQQLSAESKFRSCWLWMLVAAWGLRLFLESWLTCGQIQSWSVELASEDWKTLKDLEIKRLGRRWQHYVQRLKIWVCVHVILVVVAFLIWSTRDWPLAALATVCRRAAWHGAARSSGSNVLRYSMSRLCSGSMTMNFPPLDTIWIHLDWERKPKKLYANPTQHMTAVEQVEGF